MDPLPAGYDLVFLSAIIHSNSAKENSMLLRKCARSLNPGGRVVVQVWVMSPDRFDPVAGAFFAINMPVNNTTGDTYTESEVTSWMKDAGLSRIARRATRFGVSQISGYRTD